MPYPLYYSSAKSNTGWCQLALICILRVLLLVSYSCCSGLRGLRTKDPNLWANTSSTDDVHLATCKTRSSRDFPLRLLNLNPEPAFLANFVPVGNGLMELEREEGRGKEETGAFCFQPRHTHM